MKRDPERFERLFVVVSIGKRYPIEPCQSRRCIGVGDATRHDRDDPLTKPRALFQLPTTNGRSNRIRTYDENNGVGDGDQPGKTLFPGLSRGDVGLVNKGFEIQRREVCNQMLRERQIFAGIGDKYVGAPVAFLYHRGRALAHYPSPNWSVYLIAVGRFIRRQDWLSRELNRPKLGPRLPEFTKI